MLVHKLLERLPELPVAEREAAALRWLERQARDLADTARGQIVRSVRWRCSTRPNGRISSRPEALAEVPIAAVVEGQVVAGTDRPAARAPDGEVLVVDFKTATPSAGRVGEVPPATLRQMAAYAAALEAIYPGREVRGRPAVYRRRRS